MTVAVLALQGAFAEHEKVLKRLGVNCIELRQAKDLQTPYDGIILPGGESTVQGKLLKELGMFDTIKEQIENGMPVLATCAGLILLASEVEDQEGCHFGTIPMCVHRNAYGRQLGSFHTTAEVKGVGEVPMTFIRAPYVAETGDGVEVLATVDGKIVGVQYKNQMAFAFHPELDDDTRIHEKFAEMIRDK
jgi:5'-phosphate synthase pdxT subunit